MLHLLDDPVEGTGTVVTNNPSGGPSPPDWSAFVGVETAYLKVVGAICQQARSMDSLPPVAVAA